MDEHQKTIKQLQRLANAIKEQKDSNSYLVRVVVSCETALAGTTTKESTLKSDESKTELRVNVRKLHKLVKSAASFLLRSDTKGPNWSDWFHMIHRDMQQLLDELGARNLQKGTKVLSSILNEECRDFWNVYPGANQRALKTGELGGFLNEFYRENFQYSDMDKFFTFLFSYSLHGKLDLDTVVSVEEFRDYASRWGPLVSMPLRIAAVCIQSSPPSVQPWYMPHVSGLPPNQVAGVRISQPGFTWMHRLDGVEKKSKILYGSNEAVLETYGYTLAGDPLFHNTLGDLVEARKCNLTSDLNKWKMLIKGPNHKGWSSYDFSAKVRYSGKDSDSLSLQLKNNFGIENLAQADSLLTCAICLSEKRNVVFTGCAHVVCCNSCAKKILSGNKKCPICRQEIDEDDVLELYFA